jgi:tetratricopeptide (TPR) repeat protein
MKGEPAVCYRVALRSEVNPAPDSSQDTVPVDFFVSYTSSDLQSAKWTSDVLTAAGFKVLIQARDFDVGENFVSLMDRAVRTARSTLALLSPEYFKSPWAAAEWTSAFARAVKGQKQALIPVLIKPCDLGVLAGLAYIDLVGCTPDQARSRLLDGVQSGARPILFQAPFPEVSPAELQTGRSPRVWNLSSPGNFVGRSRILDDLQARFAASPNRICVQALTGLGGAGKTRLALEYANRAASDFDLVWRVRADDRSSISSDFGVLANELGLPVSAASGSAVKTVAGWLRRNDRWLLIFDNVQEVAAYTELGLDGPGRVLITSRLQGWGQVAHVVVLGPLSQDESVEFLSRRVTAAPDEMESLAEALGGLPLALEQAASFLDETKLEAPAYRELLRVQSGELLGEGKPTDYDETVASTWNISFERVEQESPAAARLLRICAFFAPGAIPRDLFRNAPASCGLEELAENPLRLSKAIGVLNRYSLAVVTADSLSLHGLVQAVLRDTRIPESETGAWIQRALDAIRVKFPTNSDDFRAWPLCAILLPHALAVAGHAEASGIDRIWSGWLVDRAATYLESLGNLDEARRLAELAIRITARGADSTDEYLASRLNNLGTILIQQNDFQKAREVIGQSLAMDEARLGKDHPELASRLCNLGTAVALMGEAELARSYMERSVHLAGPDDEDATVMLANLAEQIFRAGDAGSARSLLEKVLQAALERFATDDPRIAIFRQQLAEIAEDQRRWADSRMQRLESLRISVASLGIQHPATRVKRCGFAYWLAAHGEPAAAADLADAILRGQDSPMNAATGRSPQAVDWEADDLANAGLTFRLLNRYEAALSVYEKCLDLEKRKYGGESPEIAVYLSNIGITLCDLGRVSEGHAYLDRAIRLSDPAADALYPIYLANLALAEAQQGNTARAQELAENAVQLAEAQDPQAALPLVLEKTGRVYLTLGQSGPARRRLQRFVDMQTPKEHPEHPLLVRAIRLLETLPQ